MADGTDRGDNDRGHLMSDEQWETVNRARDEYLESLGKDAAVSTAGDEDEEASQ